MSSLSVCVDVTLQFEHSPPLMMLLLDVVVGGWWRDVYVICSRGVVQCWVLQSSLTCFAYCLSFPTNRFFRSNKPCIIVFQIVTVSGLTFFIFHKRIQVVFLLSCEFSNNKQQQK